MKLTQLLLVAGITTVAGVIACTKDSALTDKSAAKTGLQANKNASAFSLSALSTCDQFAYADTIFFPSNLPNDYVVKPLTVQVGSYGAFPDGLDINSVNGNIDITESETGLKYIVWFVAKGTKDTCKKYITVSGINYTDSIYTLANNPGVAAPVYNATPLKPTDCSGGCEFDDGPDDDNGNGTADEPAAGQEVIPQGIAMNKITGKIDLKKSIQNGALGVNPKNGAFKDFVLNYRISDKSAKSLNKISFRLYYYKTQAQIPANLKKQLATKQSQVLVNDDKHGDDDINSHSLSLATSNSVTGKKGAGEVKCRPPYIIVTQK